MKSKSQVMNCALVLSLALVSASFGYAQAQTQTGAPTEVAKLSDPANASPPGTDGSPATATSDAPSAKAAAPAASPAILNELDAMKKRIAELEAELAGHAAGASPDATESTPAVATSPDFSSSSSAAATRTSSAASQGVAPATADKKPPVDPFSLYDYTWMNGNSRNHDTPLATKYFSPEFRADTNYIIDYNHPIDHTMGGATESFRSGEVQVEQLSAGGDLRVGNVRGRVLTMFGLFATTTPRNDASFGVGQWDLRDAYKYVSEAWGGYHFNVNHGLNVDAGIFVSYIGLFSYYNFDNWAYQPSFVSSNTPWFFNGLRVQWFPTAKLKIEPWFINGWQSYARFNGKPGLGGQILWRPNGWLSLVFNNYGLGTDVLGNPNISRLHTDDSVELKYYDHPDRALDWMAFSVTADAGCQFGPASPLVGAMSCFGTHGGAPKESFFGAMAYNRWDFAKNRYGITFGGGFLNNPGRYLTLLPPINGADAVTGSPYFTENPGDKYHGIDTTLTFDYMPSQFLTFRFETGYRHSDVPYWTGSHGITPPGFPFGGTTGAPASYVCTNGITSDVSVFTPSGAGFAIDNAGNAITNSCITQNGKGWMAWQPDLVKNQWANTFAIMVKF